MSAERHGPATAHTAYQIILQHRGHSHLDVVASRSTRLVEVFGQPSTIGAGEPGRLLGTTHPCVDDHGSSRQHLPGEMGGNGVNDGGLGEG